MQTKEQVIERASQDFFWGDSAESTYASLISHPEIGSQEAEQLMSELRQEQREHIREEGLHAVIKGALLIAIPIIFYGISLFIGILYIKIFGLCCAAGLYGVYSLVDGSFKMLRPSQENTKTIY